MATLTISLVRSWDPGALTTAAGEVGRASSDIEQAAGRLQSAMDTASATWVGAGADAAAARVAEEAATGRRLATALTLARDALANGGTQLTTTRSHLLGLVSDAQSAGFTVADDGRVTAPRLPPVLTTPGDTTAATERAERQATLDAAASWRASGIQSALLSVAQTDTATGAQLAAVEIPAELVSDVESFVTRLTDGAEALLAAGGAGAVALGNALRRGWGLFGRTRSYAQFIAATGTQLRNLIQARAFVVGATADASAFARFALAGRAGAQALQEFQFGRAGGLLSRIPGLGAISNVAGKAFLPLTVATGLYDTWTGGGYDGARGVATRVAGAAGAVGAGALIASSAGLIALGPVGLGIAGAAVIGYGVWSLGNYVYDHWGEISDFAGNAASWVGDRASDAANWVGDRASDAADWAGDRLDDARDAVGGAVDAVAEGGKRLVDGALNIVSLGWL